MLLWQAIILAVVQGLTEFLPISSSAHLILVPELLHWPDPGLAFDVALHLGTLIAVLLYFFREWIQLTLCGLGFHYPKRASEQMVLQNQRLFWYLVAGTIPGALVGFFFEHWIEENLRNPIPIACAMIGIALLMWYAEYSARLTRRIEQASLGDSLAIGTSQALALSTPLIAGAAAKEVPKLLKLHHAGALDLPQSTLFASIAVSAVVGFIVIAFFLQYLQTRTLKIFIYYRIAFGIVILLLAFLHLGFAR
jgi:undecaprenyl-diphosphatase